MFFAAVLSLVKLMTRLSVRQLLLPGLIAPIALAVSSLGATWQGAVPETTLLGFALRFIPAAMVFGFFNQDGRAHFAGMATLWSWIWLEIIFVLRFNEQPALSDFISNPIVFYLMLPATTRFLMLMITPLAHFLGGTSSLCGSHARKQ